MSTETPIFTCPKCGSHNMTEVMWGNLWDWDNGKCLDCGYEGELDTDTGYSDDGIFQIHKEDEEE